MLHKSQKTSEVTSKSIRKNFMYFGSNFEVVRGISGVYYIKIYIYMI